MEFSRLMQRIGRVNRIGSIAPYIYNYVFYPSAQGNNEINLVKNSLSKIQAFHTAFGEDNQIYSTEEIVPLSNSACKMIPARYESYFRQNIIENY
jgi:hypothetical protein